MNFSATAAISRAILLLVLLAVVPSSAFAAYAPTPPAFTSTPLLGSPLSPSAKGALSRQIDAGQARNRYEKGLLRAGIEPYSKHPSETGPYAVCPVPISTQAGCLAVGIPRPQRVAELGLARPSYDGSGKYGGYSPADLRSAYDLPLEGGEGLTVAITIAYDDPEAESDLATYRSNYGLSACTTENGCFAKVNQRGEGGKYPKADASWALETSLDLDMVSAICPQCHILLVEADSNTLGNLGIAVEKAAQMGADVISDSWAAEEFSGETSYNHYYSHPGIPVLFASGDWGYGVYYPAASPDVVAVGGTTLRKAEGTARKWSETAWEAAGSGCSEYEKKPEWQTDEGCAKRTVADVSAVADPGTPVSVYDSYEYAGWTLLGGTSVATPLMAGVEALSSAQFQEAGPAAFTRAGEGGELFDVTEGENGSCHSYLCQGEPGYDGPTGWGTPNGPLSLPVAITEGASVLSTTEATVHGSVNPSGLGTEYRFEYGGTTSYGTSVPIPDEGIGQGTEYVSVSQTLSGLEGHRTYHYRVTATNKAGVFHGADRIFATTLPSVEPVAASEIHANDATLHAGVNPEGVDTSYWFEYGTSTSYGRSAPTNPRGGVGPSDVGSGTESVAVSEAIGGLAPDTTYHFRINAKDAAGTVHGEDQTFVTGSAEWSAEPTPYPEDGTHSALTDVSCASQYECMAVGYTYWNGFSELWNGKEWSVEPFAGVPGADTVWLESVSCTEADWCVAAGFSQVFKTAVLEPVVEVWDGANWTLDSLPALPAETEESGLYDVSCASSAACTAVGWYRTPGFPEDERHLLAERWNGTWTQQLADPSNLLSGELYSVSCATAATCVAVGWYEDPEYRGWALARQWQRSTGWSTIQKYEPKTSNNSAYLGAVACASAEACTVLGTLDAKPGMEPERWNGTSWTTESLPEPVGSEAVWPNGVACPDVDTCTLVGESKFRTNGSVPVSYRWNGSQWSLQTTAEPTQEEEGPRMSGGQLFGVSCPSVSRCIAAGLYVKQLTEGVYGNPPYRSVVERWNLPGPTTATEPASDVGWFDATLHAMVNPGGSETSYQLEYGTSTAYGASVPASPEAIGSGTEDIIVSKKVESLEPGVTYHFRVKATNANGITYGEDRTFTTRPPAAAHSTFSFGQAGTGQGQLREPRGLAVDASGNVWVADTKNSRIEEFNPEGEFLRAAGKEGSGPGQFGTESPHDVAVDAEGNLWATDTANNRIEEFNGKGEYLGKVGEGGEGKGQLRQPYGLAVDGEGNLWVADSSNKRVEKLSTKGEYVSQFATSSDPGDVAIDPDGNVWVAEYTSNRIAKFDQQGKELLAVGVGEGSGQGQFHTPSGLATDWEGDVWVADSENNRIEVLDSQGKYITAFGSKGTGAEQLEFPSALALTPAGVIWVLDSHNNRVEHWTYGPTATTQAPGPIGTNEANLRATVNPQGNDTHYQFQYGKDRTYGQSTPLSWTRVGVGTQIVWEIQKLTGLSPGTTYHYRIVATNAGGTTYGNDYTFTTRHVEVLTEAATEVTAKGAWLHGTVMPQGFDTHYRFEYGKTTSYGSLAPSSAVDIGSGIKPVAVSQSISGLSSGTTYHFRIRASAGGETVYGKDETFKTPTG